MGPGIRVSNWPSGEKSLDTYGGIAERSVRAPTGRCSRRSGNGRALRRSGHAAFPVPSSSRRPHAPSPSSTVAAMPCSCRNAKWGSTGSISPETAALGAIEGGGNPDLIERLRDQQARISLS